MELDSKEGSGKGSLAGIDRFGRLQLVEERKDRREQSLLRID